MGVVGDIETKVGTSLLSSLWDILARFFAARSPAFQAQAAQNAKLLADSRAAYTSLLDQLNVANGRIAAYDTERTRLLAQIAGEHATQAAAEADITAATKEHDEKTADISRKSDDTLLHDQF